MGWVLDPLRHHTGLVPKWSAAASPKTQLRTSLLAEASLVSTSPSYLWCSQSLGKHHPLPAQGLRGLSEELKGFEDENLEKHINA